ncbi:MAG: hypothetical protein QOH04_1728 [Sphingomonadales bacterium]|nr:hypothetical protein [Sphingomonadales bacterium]MEA3035963.1 hypothetical protein [Sphingomonadales bacterium]
MSSFDAVTLSFHGITHLRVKRSAFVAFQTWIEGEGHYRIEIVLTGGSAIRTEYDTMDKWKWVIDQLEKLL